MRNNIASGFAGRKRVLAAAGVPILVAVWWAFRPEKLWINKRVDEPAPFSSRADPQPLYTGRLHGKGQPLTGRATVYKTANGREYLDVAGFSGSSAALRVALVQTGKEASGQRIELGELTPQSDQKFDMPAFVDLSRYHTIVIYGERPGTLLGLAKLEPF